MSEEKKIKTIEELAAEQGIKAVENPRTLLGGWPEEEDFEEFLAALRMAREDSERQKIGEGD